MNPELTYTLPPFQTACGIADMMAHIMERYFTNTKDVEIGDRLCEGTLLAIIKEATTVMKNPKLRSPCQSDVVRNDRPQWNLWCRL